MNLVIVILAAAGAFLLGASLVSKTEHTVLPALQTQLGVKASIKNLALPQEMNAVDAASAKMESANDLETLFRTENLPSTAKADLIDAAMKREDDQLNSKAAQLLREMVEHGTISDVMAVLPKATHFSEATANDIASLQESLCRFQSSPEDEIGFEIIKMKFNLVFRNQVEITPWQTICRAS